MSVSSPTPSRRRLRPALRILARVTVALVVLVMLFVGALHLGPVRDYVLREATSRLEAQGVDLSADGIRYNLLGLSLSLENTRIAAVGASDLPAFLAFRHATVNLSLRNLLRGRYVVESARIEGAVLHYVTAADGRSNLPVPPRDPGEDVEDEVDDALDYLLQDVVMVDARVRYEDRRNETLDIVLPIDRLEVDGQPLTGRHDVRITAGGGSAHVGERLVAIDEITAEADIGSEDVLVENAELRSADSWVSVSGEVDDFSAPVLDLTIGAELESDWAASLAGLDEEEAIDGRIRLDATVRGPVDEAVITGEVRTDAVTARGLAPAALSIDVEYETARQVASISSMQITAPWGAATASGRVAVDEGQRTNVTVRLDRLDARAVMDALDSSYAAASFVDGTIDVTMPGLLFRQASGNASLTLTPSARAVAPSVVPAAGEVRASIDTGALSAELNLSALAAELTGAVSLGRDDALGGTVRVQAVTDQMIAAIETLLDQPRGSLSPTPVSGVATVDARLGGRLDAPAVTGTLLAPSLQVGQVEGVAVQASAAYTPDRVQLRELSVAWQEAIARAEGSLSLSGARAVSLRVNVDDFDIATVLSALDRPDVPASGTIVASGIVEGTLDRPLATMELRASDLVAYDEPLGALTVDAALDGRQARVTRASLEKPQDEGVGTLNVSGNYHLDTQAYAFSLDSDNLRIESLTLPNGSPLRGVVDLVGEGSGTVSNPGGQVRLAAREVRLADRELGDVTASVELADRVATIAADAERFATYMKGEIGTEAPYAGRVELVLNDLPLEALPLDLEMPVSGRLRARVDLKGPATDPEAGTATATIEALDATVNGQPLSLASPATIAYADRVVNVDRLQLQARDSTVTIGGSIPIDADAPPGALDLEANLQLASLAAYAPERLALEAEGVLLLNGRITGTVASVDPDITLRMNDGFVMMPELGAPLREIQLDAAIRDGVAALETLTANWAEGRIEATARLPLALIEGLPVAVPQATGAVTLEARATNLDPALVPGAPPDLGGLVTVSAEASGPRAELAALDGRVTFDALELSFRELTLAQRQPSAVSLADGVATIESFSLAGSVGNVDATGTIGLSGDQPLDVLARGSLDLAVANGFTDAVRVQGPTSFEVRATGSAAAPDLNGFIETAGGSMVVDEPAVAVEDLQARFDLVDRRVTLSALSGLVNGGTLSGGGFLVLGEGLVEDVNLTLGVDDLAFSAPLDLRSLSDVSLEITEREGEILLGGQVTIAEAGLTGDVNFDTGILAAIGRPRGLDLTEERNPLVERVRLNVGVETKTPILVNNNIAKAELTTDVRVLGTPYDLGLSGRMELLEGSTVTLNERRYEVEQGLITFTDETRITPAFDLRLTTDARHFDVTLAVSGAVGETEMTLTSVPALPEPDIMALLVTGRTLDEMRGEEYDVAREQALSYLTGRVGSGLGRRLERATGLSEVRVEPNLIANETDPGARLTIAQDLTNSLRLIYSAGLIDSSNEIWVTEYDLTRRFQTRVVRDESRSYRFDFRHDLRFGGAPEPRRVPRERPVITRVEVETDREDRESRIRSLFDLRPGASYDFFALREGVERIEQGLREDGFLESRVRTVQSVSEDERTAEITARVTHGPRVRLEFHGVTPPEDVREEIALRWQRGIFDSQRGGDALDTLRAWLMDDDHLDPRLDFTVEDVGPAERRVVFDVDPGVAFAEVSLVFEGAQAIDPDTLRDIVSEQDLERDLFTDPFVVTELLERYYREEGYLAARLDEPVLEFTGTEARVVVPVTEGPRFVVDDVTTTGNAVVPADVLLAEIPLKLGELFLPFVVERSLELMRGLYWARGFNDVRLDYEVNADRETGRTGVTFLVDEGRPSVVVAVDVEGVDRTSEDFVRGELELRSEDILNLSALGRSRRNLYNTGAYSIVEIERQEVEPSSSDEISGTSTGAADTPPADDVKPVALKVSVREVQPFQVSYGLSYDTEGQLGGLLDLANHNSLGLARTVGISSRYDAQLRQARVYLSQPMLERFPLQTTLAAQIRQERNPDTDTTLAFNTDRIGASIHQERELANQYVWNYGVRYEQTRTFDPGPAASFDDRVTVTPITSTFTRETRDEMLDATEGSLISQAFSYAPGWLGSGRPYLKYYGQYFTYFPLEPVRRERLTHEILRPRFVFATGIRVGLARGLGGIVPRSERFFAGGSTTLRGFGQNAVGPIGEDGIPAGGNATLIVNNELRFPLVSIVDGVGFLDVGGVFPTVGNLAWRDVRKTAGAGIRVRTPWFLLRGDYGFVLDRRAGEPRGQFFFSIGQAF